MSVSQFIFGNLLPVTLGNIVGGALCVAGAYTFVYAGEGQGGGGGEGERGAGDCQLRATWPVVVEGAAPAIVEVVHPTPPNFPHIAQGTARASTRPRPKATVSSFGAEKKEEASVNDGRAMCSLMTAKGGAEEGRAVRRAALAEEGGSSGRSRQDGIA